MVTVEMRLRMFRVPREPDLDKFETVQVSGDTGKLKAILNAAIKWLDDLEAGR